MRVRSLDENKDWTFGKGKENYYQKSLAIKQDIETAINEWVGDCFFANNNGIDWKNRLEKRQQKKTVAEVKSLISRREGVVEVIEISSNLTEDRVLTITYKIKTIYSDTIENIIEVS